jgi:hypothetical protein
MLIIRRVNCIDVASGIFTLKISEWSKITSIQFAALRFNAANCMLVVRLWFQIECKDEAE